MTQGLKANQRSRPATQPYAGVRFGALRVAQIFAIAIISASSSRASAEDPDGHHTRIEGPRADADTAVGRAQLRRAAATDLGQVLEGETGLRVTRLGGLGAFSTVSVRGSTAEQVMVLLDSIPLGGADGAPVDLGTIPLGPLAGIDIYRGYTPARFGVPALAGAINLRTRRLTAPEAGGEVGAGSLSTRLLRAYGGASGISVHFDALGSLGDFRYTDDRGTRFTTADDVERTRVNNGSAHYSGLVRGSFAPTKSLELNILYLGSSSTRRLPGLGVHPTQQSESGLTRHVAGASVELRAGALTGRLALNVASTESVVRDPLGELGPPRAKVTRHGLVPGATLNLTYTDEEATTPWQVALHAAWRTERMRGDGLETAARHLVTIGSSFEMRLPKPRLRLMADVQLVIAVDDQGPAARPTAPGDTGRLRVDWKPARDQQLSLTVTRSFRLPSLYERFGDTGLVLGNAGLLPERAHALEAAWTSALLPSSESSDTETLLQLNVFSRWHTNLIQFLQNAQNVARPENIASAFFVGAEASLTLRHAGWLEGRVATTYLYTEDTSNIAARTGKDLPLRPRLVANARVRVKPHPILGVALDFDYMGANYLDAANLVATSQRVLIGVHVDAHIEDFKVIVSCTNILGSRVQDLAGFPLPGLAAFATLRWEPQTL